MAQIMTVTIDKPADGSGHTEFTATWEDEYYGHRGQCFRANLEEFKARSQRQGWTVVIREVR